jgi:hypothetical protein
MIVTCWISAPHWSPREQYFYEDIYMNPLWLRFEFDFGRLREDLKDAPSWIPNYSKPELIVWTFQPSDEQKAFMETELPGVEQITHLRVD